MSYIEPAGVSKTQRLTTFREGDATLDKVAREVMRAVRRDRLSDAYQAMRDIRPFIARSADDRHAGKLDGHYVRTSLLAAVEAAGAREQYGRALVAWLMEAKPGEQPPDDVFEKPTIVVRPNTIFEQVSQAEKALIEAQLGVYQFGGRLVRLEWAWRALPNGRSEKSLRMVDLNDHSLCELFDRAATWETEREKGNVVHSRPSNCPAYVARTHLARGGIGWHVPTLTGVLRAPTIRPNGEILDLPGFDMESGLFLDFEESAFSEIPDQPTVYDAEEALDALLDLTKGFPCVCSADETSPSESVLISAILTAILTAICRPALPAAPLHAITATSIGTGKSYATDIIATVATGGPVAPIAAGANDEELEKRLAAALIGGQPFIVIDNVTREINGDLLNQVLTQPKVAPRRLGHSENVEIPARAFMMMNGNNLSVAADMARRVLLCSLDARVERPELREFDSNPLEMVRENRGRYVAAALTILRAYIVAGKPNRPKPLGSFEAWSDLVRGALIWLGMADPVATMAQVREADPRRLQLLAVMAHWNEVIGDERVTVNEVIAAAVRSGGEFREALLAVAGERGAIDGRRLGRWLGAHKGRIVDGRWIEAGPLRRGTGTWQLCGEVGKAAPESSDMGALM